MLLTQSQMDAWRNPTAPALSDVCETLCNELFFIAPDILKITISFDSDGGVGFAWIFLVIKGDEDEVELSDWCICTDPISDRIQAELTKAADELLHSVYSEDNPDLSFTRPESIT